MYTSQQLVAFLILLDMNHQRIISLNKLPVSNWWIDVSIYIIKMELFIQKLNMYHLFFEKQIHLYSEILRPPDDSRKLLYRLQYHSCRFW